MTENEALVVEISPQWVKVRVLETQSTDESCSAKGCGQCATGCSAKEKIVQVQRESVDIGDDLSLGKRVVLVVDDTRLFRSAATMFCVPLAGFLGGALLAQQLEWSAGESFALAGLGLAIAAAMTRGWLEKQTRHIFQIKTIG